MKLLVSPIEKIDWEISVQGFLQFLIKLYPKAEVASIENKNSPYIYEWNYKDKGFYLQGHLYKNLSSILLETSQLYKCKEFIIRS